MREINEGKTKRSHHENRLDFETLGIWPDYTQKISPDIAPKVVDMMHYLTDGGISCGPRWRFATSYKNIPLTFRRPWIHGTPLSYGRSHWSVELHCWLNGP